MTGGTVSRPGTGLPPALLRAYRETEYRIGSAVVRIGGRSPGADAALAALGGRRGCRLGGTAQGGLLTAWNPRSRPLPAPVNIRRQERLLARLGPLPFLSASGFLRRWQEEHVLVAADPRRLAVLGRRFGQNAIVVLRAGQKARLLWL